MFDWLRGDKEQEHSGDEQSGSINALYQHVQIIRSEVGEIKDNLLDEYATEGLSNLSCRFEKISKDFSDYTIIRHHIFYEIIRRSSSRTTTAKNIAKQAKKVAELFEKYARSSRSYRRVSSRLAIDKLTAELVNLEANCTLSSSND